MNQIETDRDRADQGFTDHQITGAQLVTAGPGKYLVRHFGPGGQADVS